MIDEWSKDMSRGKASQELQILEDKHCIDILEKERIKDIFSLNISDSTYEKIREIQQKVDLMRDKLDYPIDDLIKLAVVALRLLEFPTCGSCQGHINWGLPYPWIDVDAWWDDENLDDENIRKIENDKYLTKFREILEMYNSASSSNHQDIDIECYGCFGAFRIKAISLDKINKFADFLIKMYNYNHDLLDIITNKS